MSTHSLPSLPTPFIGRERELTEIATLLATPDCRLLTLTGQGGMGKTRLALEVARSQAEAFAHGVHFVALQPLTSADLIALTIIAALGLQFSQGDPRQQLLGYLTDKSLLLVLDNVEHLLDDILLVSDVLTHVPGVKILATSRERLNLREEWLYPVEGMFFPHNGLNGDLDRYDAVRLFVSSARRLRPDFSLADEAASVLELCALLDGIPLALELAASWVRVLTCAEIVQEIQRGLDLLETSIRNVEERHRSMRAVLEHSWRRLSQDEQDALMKLSVFRGGFTREAAEAVAGASLDTLASLVDGSLVKHGETGRYDLHEMLRQFAAEKLLDAGEENATIQRHYDYFLRLAEGAEAHAFGREQTAWFDRLEEEFDNLRAALAWSAETTIGLRLAGALGWFFSERTHWWEGLDWLTRILAANPDAPALLRAKALQYAGALTGHSGYNTRTRALLEHALALARAANDRWNIAWILSWMAILAEKDAVQSAALLDESLALFRELEDPMGLAHTIIRRSWIARSQGDYAYARKLVDEVGIIAGKEGDRTMMGWVSLELGQLSRHYHDLSQARTHYENSLSLFHDARFPNGYFRSLLWLAEVEQTMGNAARVQMLMDEARILLREIESDTSFLRLVLGILASQARERGQFERAVTLIVAANSSHLVQPAARNNAGANIVIDSYLEELRAQLGEIAFAEAWAAGKAMTREQAVTYALDRRDQSTEQGVASEAAQPDSPSLTGPLNNRELEILRLIADGLSNREIAERLFLAVTTVKWYVREILSKLHVNNRTQAVARARTLGMLS